jgi:hypothetical protein
MIRQGDAIKVMLANCGCHKRKNKPYQWVINKISKDLNRRNRNIELSLTPEQCQEIAKQKYCTYCHTPIEWKEYSPAKGCSAYYLDRMNNDIGYTKENCTPCCIRCNFSKSNKFTYKEWYIMTEPFRSGLLQRA